MNKRVLLTVVTEAVIEVSLCQALQKLGASGYTITDARGSGSRGIRDGGWSTSRNIRVEVVCQADTAQKISEYLLTHFYDNYAMVSFQSDVHVLRPEKFKT